MEQDRMRPLLRCQGISIGHGNKELIRNVDLELMAGELVALIGVNGSGKSSLLRVLAGLTTPVAGTVLLEDAPLHLLTARTRARRIALVRTGGQRPGFMSVRELVSMGRYPWTGRYGRSSARDAELVEEAMMRMGIAHMAQRMVDTLSDGEHQKVVIACALAQDASVLLLDEPTAFLDLVNKVELLRILVRIAHEQGKAILVATHDLRTAMEMADRMAVIHAKGLVRGAPDEDEVRTVLGNAFGDLGLSLEDRTGGIP